MKKIKRVNSIATLLGCLLLVVASASAQCVSGNCFSGKGTYRFTDGSQYAGNFQRGKMQGYGAFHYANEDVYQGNWEQGVAEGSGIYFYKSGEKYEGDFAAGRLEGFGTMHYPNGVRYVGEWKTSKKNGRGILYRQDNSTARIGYWKNGTFVGEEEPSAKPTDVASNGGATTQKILPSTPIIARAAPTKEVKIWALVVGVARYNAMPSLRYTDDDAYQFYAFLKSPEGGALPNEQVRVLIDEDATQANIRSSLRILAQQADENDVVMFYFSGHGVENAFVPSDFDGRFSTALSHETIKQLLEESRAKHKICIADACHAGTLLAAKGASIGYGVERLYAAFEQAHGGTALLLSSKGDENSLEDTGLRSGVFSHFLIKGLRGDADTNQNKIVTVAEIFDFISKNVRRYTATAQSPLLSGDFDSAMPVAILR